MNRHDATTSEAAADLHIGVSTLQSWAAQGIVRPKWRTPGGHARWDIDDLRQQLEMPPTDSEDHTSEEVAKHGTKKA